MTRTVTKAISSATVYALDPSKPFDTDDNGMPLPNLVFAIDGNPTSNRARIAAQKAAGHKNVMVLRVDVDESKVKVAPATFYANSSICVSGESYSREYVTQTFKVTRIHGFYIDAETGAFEPFTHNYFGVTTDSKLLKAVRDVYGLNAVISETVIEEQRRFMTRETYMELATVSASEAKAEADGETA